jgi:hypothetical protein
MSTLSSFENPVQNIQIILHKGEKTLNLHYKDPSVDAAREIIAVNLRILTKN